MTDNNQAPELTVVHGGAGENLDLEKTRAELLQEIKVTKGSRFNASKRLETAEKRRTSLIAFVSICVIVVSLLPVFFSTSQLVSNILTLITVAFSIVILAASLIQSSNADAVKAEQFQRCALELNSLRREIRSERPISEAKLKEFSRSYDQILQKYNINHDDVDFEKYKLEHPAEYPEVSGRDEAALRKEVTRQQKFSEALRTAIGATTILAAAAAAGGESASRLALYLFEVYNSHHFH